ncbi:dipeptide ABC transporter ATP-binding protein [soil metagenome]|jgi:peptide/nickel transport system ATP-binding protein
MSTDGELLLRAQDVVKDFPLRRQGLGERKAVHAVDRVSLEVRVGETLGIVGESGCGKSTLGRCLARLTDLTSGRIELAGRDITSLSRRQLRPVRRDVQMVFQDPYASLNPRRRVGEIVAEPLLVQGFGDRAATEARVAELFDVVGLSAGHIDRYPHEFSGGQRQRVGIARALAMSPKLIVADEPVSALDVSIQAQVLNLFADLQDELGLTYVFIAHDLGVVKHVSDRIAVMYLGAIVEITGADALYEAPAHPYTEALLSAAPEIDDGLDEVPRRERIVLTGDVPNPVDRPTGCAFHTRCPYRQDVCVQQRPPLIEVAPGRVAACHFPLINSIGVRQDPHDRSQPSS